MCHVHWFSRGLLFHKTKKRIGCVWLTGKGRESDNGDIHRYILQRERGSVPVQPWCHRCGIFGSGIGWPRSPHGVLFDAPGMVAKWTFLNWDKMKAKAT
jgi:hypothetical protein